ncbi:MAG: response regulator [Flavobacteriales bacterium]|jgi:CheY-like chemotaxis protein|nr:response regulator [Flavobacteriales bacterium]
MTKLLLIEDDLDVRENVSEILELSGYDVISAENGVEGVKLAKKEIPELIICDVMMPEMDGYGVLYSLSQDPELAHIPFIFLTAKTEKEDLRKGMQMGADDYLTKPFESTELLFAIESRLKKNALIRKKYSSSLDGLENFVQDTQSVSKLDSILASSNKVSYLKKDVIYREGARPNQIYYLNSGRVKTIKLHEDGKELIVDFFNKGDFFGLVAAMTETEYQHSAICLEDCEITALAIQDFQNLIRSNNDVTAKLIKILAGNVQTKEVELLEIAYGTVRSRVAEGLVKIAENYSDEIESGLPLTREEIAQFIGIATETLIRTLSDFKDEGLVTSNGKRIVPVLDKLQNLKY